MDPSRIMVFFSGSSAGIKFVNLIVLEGLIMIDIAI